MEDKIKKLGILVRRAAARWIRERRTDSTVQEAQPQSDVTNRETAKMEKESPTARPVSGEPRGAANPTCLTSPDESISAQKDKEIFSRYQETISKNRETNQKERKTRTEAGPSFPLRPLTKKRSSPSQAHRQTVIDTCGLQYRMRFSALIPTNLMKKLTHLDGKVPVDRSIRLPPRFWSPYLHPSWSKDHEEKALWQSGLLYNPEQVQSENPCLSSFTARMTSKDNNNA